MKVRWLTSALASLRSASLYIARDNPVAGENSAERIQRVVDHLGQFPLAGRQGTVPGTREIMVPGLPYLVVYRVTESEVQILRVFHSKQERH
jgi:addiction module RelE/StbE family toxin